MDDNSKKEKFKEKMLVLTAELKEWYKEQVEHEQSVIPTSQQSSEKNVWNISTRLKSIQVVQSMSIAEAVLDIEIPDDKMGKIIKSGGYETFDEMINDISPKLEKVFLEGGFEEKEKVNQE